MITFAREQLRDTWDEGASLIKLNNAETGALATEEFAPDAEKYFQLEDLGMVRLYTARICDKLIGYAIFLIQHHLHYPKTRWAIQDVLFISPEYRGLGAVRFILWTDDMLRSDGVHIVFRHVSHKRDYSRTLERLGYGAVETGFMRRL